MNPWTDLLLLSLVVVWIVDISGWTDTWLGFSHMTLRKEVMKIKAKILDEYEKMQKK